MKSRQEKESANHNIVSSNDLVNGITKSQADINKIVEDLRNIDKVTRDYLQQLRQTIETIKNVFPFDNVGVFLTNERQDALYEITNEDIFPGEVKSPLLRKCLKGPLNFTGHLSGFWGYQSSPSIFYIADQAELLQKGTALRVAFDQKINSGLKHAIGGPLIYQGKKVGLLWFSSEQEDIYNKSFVPLFIAIGEQIAPSLADIQTKELIIGAEKEKVLEITEKMAAVKSPEDLLQVITQKIKPLFDFYDCRLFVISHDQKTHTDWTINMEGVNRSEWYKKLVAISENSPHPGSAAEWMMNRMKEAAGPVLFDFSEIVAAMPDFPQVSKTDILGLGFRDCLACNLYYRGNFLGFFSIKSLQKDFFHPGQFRLFQAITNIISIAVGNIQGYEELRKNEQEKSILLSISEEISLVRDKKDLLSVIVHKIKPLFNFYDCGILIIEENNQYRNLSAVHPDIDGSEINNTINLKGFHRDNKVMSYKGSALEYLVNKIENSGKPVFFDYQKNYDSYTDGELLALVKELGYKEAVGCLLKNGGHTFGCFILNYLEQGAFDAEKISLFKNIVDQIAVAVSNILANEAILKREQEKSILLSISEEISLVRDMKDLLRVVVEKIKPLFNFYDCGIVIIDENGQYWDLAVIHPEIVGSETNNLLNYKGFYNSNRAIPYNGSALEYFIKKIEHAGKPVTFDFEGNYEGYTDAELLALYKQLGYKEGVGCLLKTGGKIFGCFVLDYLQKGVFDNEKIPLYKNIVDQIAVAVSNILANESILQRESQKSILLSITEHIASARNAVDLLTVLHEKAQALISFHDIGVIIIGENKEYYYQLAVIMNGQVNSENKLHPQQTKIERLPYPGSYVEFTRNLIEANGSPIIEHIPSRLDAFKDPFIPVMKKIGYQEGLITSLKFGGKCFGIFFFNSLKDGNFIPAQFEIFQALADQVAVAVSNILANEKLEHLLTEMEHSKTEVEKLNRQLEAQKTYLLEEAEEHYNYGEIVGKSKLLKNCLTDLGLVAHTDTTVLVLGETGTGKELIARALHNNSARKDKLLVKLNCAALPAQLIESELFGHEKGAFTGAVERRIGKFELAHGGTLFLDEIGELPLDLQAKLLRAIQEKEIERLGSNKTIKLDVRIVAATNRNLEKEVLEGRFRSDLYYRLSVFPVYLPPLRDRTEDIPLLAMHFLNKFSKKNGKQLKGFSQGAMAALSAYSWPGNIRELEHLVERQVILSTANIIKDVQLPKLPIPKTEGEILQVYDLTLEEHERQYILQVIKKCRGKISGPGGAANILGIPYTTLQSRMKRLGIKKEHVFLK